MKDGSQVKGSKFGHLPVMANEILLFLNELPKNITNPGVLIDATLGGGGHSKLILEQFPKLSLIGLDQDADAREFASTNLEDFSSRTTIIASNFANFTPTKKASIVIADLGVSSYQLNMAKRGFSFLLDGPIDMRMNSHQGITAEKLLEESTEKELADLIYENGEEKLSRRIAKRIKQDLAKQGPYTGTEALAYAIAGCYPANKRYGRIHPATRTFQALRISVNDELGSLEKFLENSPDWLIPGGILIIISFHSLEDRKVKQAFNKDDRLEKITKKPLQAQSMEIETNPRSRSAKLRIARRII